MTLEKNEFKKAYKLMNDFLDAVNNKDINKLKTEFGIIEDNIIYLYDTLSSYYDKLPKLDILPFEDFYLDATEEQRNSDIFKFNDNECWGIDARVLVDEKIDEPMLHFKLCKNDNNKYGYNLEFLYLGS